jgi:hypothetical protein
MSTVQTEENKTALQLWGELKSFMQPEEREDVESLLAEKKYSQMIYYMHQLQSKWRKEVLLKEKQKGEIDPFKTPEWKQLLDLSKDRNYFSTLVTLTFKFLRRFPQISPADVEKQLRKDPNSTLLLFAEDPSSMRYVGTGNITKADRSPAKYKLRFSTKTRDLAIKDFESGCSDESVNLERLEDAGFQMNNSEETAKLLAKRMFDECVDATGEMEILHSEIFDAMKDVIVENSDIWKTMKIAFSYKDQRLVPQMVMDELIQSFYKNEGKRGEK